MSLTKFRKSQLLHTIKLYFIALILIFTIEICINIKAVQANVLISQDFLTTKNSISRELSLQIPTQKTLGVEKISLGHPKFYSIQNQKKQLIKTSIYLRDIARLFGSDFPIFFILNQKIEENKNEYVFVRFKNHEGKWTNLTTGYALNLVTQELDTLAINQSQPLIDFIVKDKRDNSYKPILKVPLNIYCSELANFLQLN
ncbi:hypothetical protein I4641_20570 [Waterburya agarophytonicola K14]|uniref:Uncharacterized protein n=1 Tax=Waterburya agarophytonicola KI4 TaxID=2874699 RepID=A0A964BT78_9CYAN|nr:hypothetical protein [Waterburya agarophytonicola]MCC0179359.1 hypothetical protein [Waterburya agarophytonicola KI4]